MADEEYKERIRNAILKASSKLLKILKGPTRRNAHPEKDVEPFCLPYLPLKGKVVLTVPFGMGEQVFKERDVLIITIEAGKVEIECSNPKIRLFRYFLF